MSDEYYYSSSFVATFSAITIAFIYLSHEIFYLLCLAQPEPYMDEIFHIPQAQEYCKYNFTAWNPKISTPPGLYLMTVPVVKLLSYLINIDVCTVHGLRSINVLLICAAYPLTFLILSAARTQHSFKNNIVDMIVALNILTFPVLYFFSFFYYTECLSTFLILLAYYLHINKCHLSSHIVAAISITIRQTNVAWLLFLTVIDTCELLNSMQKKLKLHKLKKPQSVQEYSYFVIATVYYLILEGHGKKLILKIIRTSLVTILVTFVFLTVVLYNGSLAFGDKSAHTLVIHFPQLLYFMLFTGFFSFPYFIRPALNFLFKIHIHIRMTLLAAVLMLIIIKYNTLVHIYLLSDNRHYVFYIWNRFLDKTIVRYGLIPAYIICTQCVISNTSHVPVHYRLAYAIALCVTLIFQKLLEFRYFILPYIFFQIYLKRKEPTHSFMQFMLNCAVNFQVIYLFAYHPFTWPDGNVQRFSW